MRNVDFPLEDVRDDLLGRKMFAFSLATALMNVDLTKNGFVASITGPWGSGKSSTINFVRHYVQQISIKTAMEKSQRSNIDVIKNLDELYYQYIKFKPYIENLIADGKNPYIVSKEYLTSKMVEFDVDTKKLDDVYEYILLKRENEIRPDTTVINFSPWSLQNRSEITLSLLSEINLAIGDNFDSETYETFAKYIEKFGELATATGSDAGIGKFISKLVTLPLNKKRKTLNEIREELSKNLLLDKNKNKRIIIIIDDLDRLTPFEASETINALKGVANLPKIVYLLSYDRHEFSSLISRAIYDQEAPQKGEIFLEKIIQYTKELPLPREEENSEIFNKNFLEILSDFNVFPEEKRASLAWFYILHRYLKTPRDTIRLLNNYSVAFSVTHDITDPIDLLVLTCLETFEPSVYTALKTYVQISKKISIDEDNQELIENSLESARDKKTAKFALGFLDQSLKSAEKYLNPPPPQTFKNRAHLFSNPSSAEVYFDLDPNRSPIHKIVLEKLTPLEAPKGLLRQSISELISSSEHRQSIRPTLEALSSYFFERDTCLSIEWAEELRDVAEILIAQAPPRSSALLSTNDEIIVSMFKNGLSRCDRDDQIEILTSLINKGEDLSFACKIIRDLIGDLKSEGYKTSSIFTLPQEESFREILTYRIRKIATEHKIFNQLSPSNLIWFWWGVDEKNEVRDFISMTLDQEESTLCALLQMLIGKVFTSDGVFEKTSPRSLELLASTSSFLCAAERLSKSAIESHREVANRFKNAVKVGESGDW
ncbi:P-loop NTPase fold protein [Thalassospira lucentensis]|uniref:P-loop NTPase fold protein n=1 Tax=Thalassospira lucentensis TaxID=168935 RepID=UPI0029438797|nr:P-loop NTPase fold protein [Thalassospira lucentensis]WOI10771.1 P-loop NTPase fold protein [Thalassospira lucentensis]